MPPCSGQSRPSPAGGREDAASLDRPCARRLRELAVGMEEYSRRGSNQRMRPKRARKQTIPNRWFSGNFRLALTALEARDAGMLGMLLHYPYEVRKPEEYFEDMPEVDTPKEMIDLATHIIDTMAGHFDPAKFEDRYETAMRDLIDRKQAGEKIVPVAHASPQTTVNLMEALRTSLVEKRPPAASVPHRAGASGARRPTAKARPRTSG